MKACRLKILNIWVDAVDRGTAIDIVQDMLTHGDKPHVIFASNPEKNFSVPGRPEILRCYRNADLLLPDGIGMVLAARLIHGRFLERIPGADFFLELCHLAATTSQSIYIYGATEKVNRKAARKLTEQIPGLDIAGRSNGYLPDCDMPALVEKINQSRATVLFLSLGSPKQELWYAQYREHLTHVRVCQGIGGTLDTIAGDVKRAPDVWRKLNLEWFYRLIREPKRIRRQRVLPIFAFKVFLEAMRNHRYSRFDVERT